MDTPIMDIHYATLKTCSTATATVVVIDVWRAFTPAAFAFAAGARDIIPAGAVEKVWALGEQFPGALVMGAEVKLGGPPVKGFDRGSDFERYPCNRIAGYARTCCSRYMERDSRGWIEGGSRLLPFSRSFRLCYVGETTGRVVDDRGSDLTRCNLTGDGHTCAKSSPH